jgi:hypothetical protein
MNKVVNRYIPYAYYLLFFSFFLFFILNYFDYIFFYQEKSKLFFTTFQSFTGYLNRPGGILEYIGDFITSLYYYPVIGAVIVSLEIVLLIYFLTEISKVLAEKNFCGIAFVVGALFFYMQLNHYYFNFNTLGVLLQIGLFYLTIKYLKGELLWIAVILFPLWYYATGGFSVVYFVLFTLNMLTKREKGDLIKEGVMIAAWGIFFYLGKEFLFYVNIEDLFLRPFLLLKIGAQDMIFSVAVALISVLPLILSVMSRRSDKGGKKKIPLPLIMPMVLLFVLIYFSAQRINDNNRHYFHVEKLFYEQKFNEIVDYNTKNSTTNGLTLYLNNIALAETGQLLNKLFSFPQDKKGSTLFLIWGDDNEIRKRGGYFYYTIGLVNEAHRWAFENMVVNGYVPESIKLIMKTELINGHYKSAAKYISMLKQTMFYREEALQYEKLLFNDLAVETDPELGRIKSLVPKYDFFVNPDRPIVDIDMLLSKDWLNRRALEYQIAYLLLNKKVGRVVAKLPLLEELGYTKFPENVAEAVAPYRLLEIGEWPDLKKLKLSSEIKKRFLEFNTIHEKNPPNVQQILYDKYGNTFWYYVFYR